MQKKIIKTRTSEIWIDEQDIYHLTYTKGAEVILEDTLNECRIIGEMSDHKKVSIMADLNLCTSVSRESRKYYAGKEANEIFKTAALLVGTQISRAIGNFFLGLNNPVMPVRLFTSENKALKWLKEYNE